MERVLGRAAELQGADGDPQDDLSEEQLLDLGREVGLSPDALRRALAEERTRPTLPEERGFVASIAGPALVAAARVVPGTPATVLAKLDAWMLKQECLQSRRRQPDRLTWEPRGDAMGKLKVGLNLGGRGYHLARASEVAASVAAVDATHTHVQLVADLAPSRRVRIAGGASITAVGALAGSGLMTISFLAEALVLPIVAAAAFVTVGGAGAGMAMARTHRRSAMRVQVALEQLLDRMEQGELQAPMAGQLLEALQQAMRKLP